MFEEIDKLVADIKATDTISNYEEFVKKMEKRLDKLETEIKNKKQRKYIRDYMTTGMGAS